MGYFFPLSEETSPKIFVSEPSGRWKAVGIVCKIDCHGSHTICQLPSVYTDVKGYLSTISASIMLAPLKEQPITESIRIFSGYVYLCVCACVCGCVRVLVVVRMCVDGWICGCARDCALLPPQKPNIQLTRLADGTDAPSSAYSSSTTYLLEPFLYSLFAPSRPYSLPKRKGVGNFILRSRGSQWSSEQRSK